MLSELLESSIFIHGRSITIIFSVTVTTVAAATTTSARNSTKTTKSDFAVLHDRLRLLLVFQRVGLAVRVSFPCLGLTCISTCPRKLTRSENDAPPTGRGKPHQPGRLHVQGRTTLSQARQGCQSPCPGCPSTAPKPCVQRKDGKRALSHAEHEQSLNSQPSQPVVT